MSVLQMLPTWPDVRCDQCRTVYTIPDDERDGIVTGDCPRCHHERFSTAIKADGPIPMIAPSPEAS